MCTGCSTLNPTPQNETCISFTCSSWKPWTEHEVHRNRKPGKCTSQPRDLQVWKQGIHQFEVNCNSISNTNNYMVNWLVDYGYRMGWGGNFQAIIIINSAAKAFLVLTRIFTQWISTHTQTQRPNIAFFFFTLQFSFWNGPSHSENIFLRQNTKIVDYFFFK